MGHFKDNYKREKAEMNRLTDENSLWARLKGEPLTEAQIAFLQNCMDENLNHARHVENERLTFNSILLALIAGVLAIASSLPQRISFFLYLAITMAGFLSMLLTVRWNNAFSRHLFYAQQCYMLIHKHLFGDRPGDEKSEGDRWESIDGLNDIPMYCFKINSPIAYTPIGKRLYSIRTRVLYNSFYIMIQIFLITCTVASLFSLLRG